MKIIPGAAYLMKEDYNCESGRTLYKGYAVILKKYDLFNKMANIEFDGESFWVKPSYLDFIEGEVPVDLEDESQNEPQKPAHYDTGIDTIAFMRANCPPEQVEGFLRGNAIKYLQRYDKKNGVEDLRKAKHYVEMLIEELEGRG